MSVSVCMSVEAADKRPASEKLQAFGKNKRLRREPVAFVRDGNSIVAAQTSQTDHQAQSYKMIWTVPVSE